MLILKSSSQIAIMSLLLFSLASCDRGSSDYRHIKDLPDREWESFASSLPAERRLDLHKEIMERSGHNPPMTIRFAFGEQPAETYKSIVRRIKAGDHSGYYMTIIYAIDGANGFTICSQPDRKVIQDYLNETPGYPGQEKFRPPYYEC